MPKPKRNHSKAGSSPSSSTSPSVSPTPKYAKHGKRSRHAQSIREGLAKVGKGANPLGSKRDQERAAKRGGAPPRPKKSSVAAILDAFPGPSDSGWSDYCAKRDALLDSIFDGSHGSFKVKDLWDATSEFKCIVRAGDASIEDYSTVHLPGFSKRMQVHVAVFERNAGYRPSLAGHGHMDSVSNTPITEVEHLCGNGHCMNLAHLDGASSITNKARDRCPGWVYADLSVGSKREYNPACFNLVKRHGPKTCMKATALSNRTYDQPIGDAYMAGTTNAPPVLPTTNAAPMGAKATRKAKKKAAIVRADAAAAALQSVLSAPLILTDDH